VKPAWNVSQVLEAIRRMERIEPGANQPRPAIALRTYKNSMLIALLLKLPFFKQDIQKRFPVSRNC
jgi:hypothetical protein